ncbi:MAG: hypothetical protein QM775_21180 [Pirellulales bacterium]
MTRGEHVLKSLEDLRQYVYETLCDRESLVSGAFHMSEQLLVRAGKPCGMHFCVHGPRAVMITAIWETKQNSILFYDSTGVRFLTTRLVDAPQLQAMAA